MGWMELMVIGVVALIVVGPKDLPVMFQALGKMTAKVKSMAREFSSAMSDAANASGAGDIAKDLRGIADPKSMGIDKLKEAADSFEKWEPGKTPKVMDSETAKLRAERAEQTRKIKAEMAARGKAKLDAEKAEAAETAEPAPVEEAPKPKPKAKKAAKPKAPVGEGAKPKAAKPKAKRTPKPKAGDS